MSPNDPPSQPTWPQDWNPGPVPPADNAATPDAAPPQQPGEQYGATTAPTTQPAAPAWPPGSAQPAAATWAADTSQPTASAWPANSPQSAAPTWLAATPEPVTPEPVTPEPSPDTPEPSTDTTGPPSPPQPVADPYASYPAPGATPENPYPYTPPAQADAYPQPGSENQSYQAPVPPATQYAAQAPDDYGMPTPARAYPASDANPGETPWNAQYVPPPADSAYAAPVPSVSDVIPLVSDQYGNLVPAAHDQAQPYEQPQPAQPGIQPHEPDPNQTLTYPPDPNQPYAQAQAYPQDAGQPHAEAQAYQPDPNQTQTYPQGPGQPYAQAPAYPQDAGQAHAQAPVYPQDPNQTQTYPQDTGQPYAQVQPQPGQTWNQGQNTAAPYGPGPYLGDTLQPYPPGSQGQQTLYPGATLPPPYDAAHPPAPVAPAKRKTPAMIIIIVVVVAAALIGAGVYWFGLKNNGIGGGGGSEKAATPQAAVESFLTALSQGDAAKALSYASVEPTDKTFLTNEVLAASNKLGALSDIKVDAASVTSTMVNVTYQLGTHRVSTYFIVKPYGNGYLLDQVTATVNLENAYEKNMGLAVNGISLDDKSLKTVTMFPGTYQLTTTNTLLTTADDSFVIESPRDSAYFRPEWALTKDAQGVLAGAAKTKLAACLQEKALRTSCGFGRDALENNNTPALDSVVWTLQSGTADFSDVTFKVSYDNPTTVTGSINMSIQIDVNDVNGAGYRGTAYLYQVKIDITDPGNLVVTFK